MADISNAWVQEVVSKAFGTPKLLFQKRVTFLRERSIARDMTVINGLLHVFKFIAH